MYQGIIIDDTVPMDVDTLPLGYIKPIPFGEETEVVQQELAKARILSAGGVRTIEEAVAILKQCLDDSFKVIKQGSPEYPASRMYIQHILFIISEKATTEVVRQQIYAKIMNHEKNKLQACKS